MVNNRDGVLEISRTSGAYHQLAKGALSVSPTDIEGTMEGLHKAITMPQEKRKNMASTLTESICREDITHWISRQLEDIAKLL